MSKELPYFQFEPAEYLAGDIMLCSLEAQGLFSIIKCLYWQKNCFLKLSKVLKRFDRMDLIDELIEEDCIKIKQDYIVISFLNEQHKKVSKNKIRLSKAGKKGAKIRKENKEKQATLNPPLSEASTTLKQPDKIREDNIIIDISIYYKSEEGFLKDWKKIRENILAQPTNIKKLSQDESDNFKQLQKEFTIQEFRNAIQGLFKQKQIFKANILRPRHFLQDRNIEKYLDAFTNKTQLYAKEEARL